jgi:hypothetical protein
MLHCLLYNKLYAQYSWPKQAPDQVGRSQPHSHDTAVQPVSWQGATEKPS